MNRVLALPCLACALAGAQTFPPEFRTDDGTVQSRILSLLERMGNQDTALSRVLDSLVALPASRVYRQMDEQARAAALRSALPLVKKIAMSDAVRENHDQAIALRFGAVNHGLKLPPAQPDAEKRMAAMSEQLMKNPAVMRDPKFMQEYTAQQKRYMAQTVEGVFDQYLTFFTEPLAELKRRADNGRKSAGGNPELARCYDGALALGATEEQRFRLAVFRCAMMALGAEKTEAEADSLRKQRAQRLYDEKGVEGAVRRTLEEFLRTAATVDFTAQTTARDGRQVFVNPEYEKRDALWKMIYRNGQEPTQVAVQFARAWLAELTPPTPAPPAAALSAAAAARPASAAKAAPAKASPAKAGPAKAAPAK